MSDCNGQCVHRIANLEARIRVLERRLLEQKPKMPADFGQE